MCAVTCANLRAIAREEEARFAERHGGVDERQLGAREEPYGTAECVVRNA